MCSSTDEQGGLKLKALKLEHYSPPPLYPPRRHEEKSGEKIDVRVGAKVELSSGVYLER